MTNFLPQQKYIFLICALSLFISVKGQWDFKENKGQWPDQVSYSSKIPSGDIYLEKDAFTFDIFIDNPHTHEEESGPHGPMKTKKFAYKIKFKGAKANRIFPTSEASTGVYNYFIGSDPSAWASNVLAYKNIAYQNLYPGIDLNLRGNDSELKYDFIINPGADPT